MDQRTPEQSTQSTDYVPTPRAPKLLLLLLFGFIGSWQTNMCITATYWFLYASLFTIVTLSYPDFIFSLSNLFLLNIQIRAYSRAPKLHHACVLYIRAARFRSSSILLFRDRLPLFRVYRHQPYRTVYYCTS